MGDPLPQGKYEEMLYSYLKHIRKVSYQTKIDCPKYMNTLQMQ